ncbi:Hypothetical protein PSEBR_a3803 [Pseudomonas brassicacearum subsp. brassicacearum NFM421]|uniref:Uncharacterized protein n=1 Tax=Pseudomonas brassicacearum (strain NFM421) TaxID=994484 RepID=F2KJE4_PSEBN|nr:hypothetical protein [Pseudomonas brassicacearum]AEA70170.1 Hypothetical protein PSEBR_a3803 [Pseudomonas brassicacearum subsp. brassicacearum NFM421]
MAARDKYMKGVIESEAKTATGEPVWTLDKSQFLVSAGNFGLGLPEKFGEESKKKADVLERRLARMERALGLDPICDR